MSTTIDARGLTCPRPVVLALHEIKRMQKDGTQEPFDVLIDEQVAFDNLQRLAASTGSSFDAVRLDGYWSVTLNPACAEAPQQSKNAAADASLSDAADTSLMTSCPAAANPTAASTPDAGNPVCTVNSGQADHTETVFVIGSATMGKGDDTLGGILLRGFLYALTQTDTTPATLILFNDGARLACTGSESLEDLQALAGLGCRICVCGTCLDYLGLKETQQIGEVINLYLMAQIIMDAKKVVTL